MAIVGRGGRRLQLRHAGRRMSGQWGGVRTLDCVIVISIKYSRTDISRSLLLRSFMRFNVITLSDRATGITSGFFVVLSA